jgi:mannose-1-phosphate guanylyltransferase
MHAAAGRVREDSWAVVLAGGGGSRLRGCTVDHSGHHVPKQYCAIDRKHTLLQLAIARARNLVDPSRVVIVVLNQHRKWWELQLKGALPPENVVAQPLGRGTAVGVLLPLLHVLARDPDAHVVVLPADHYFRDEGRLARVIRRALEHTFHDPGTLVFVGIEPESPTSDFGYLVPQTDEGVDPKRIVSFVEKPPPDLAQRLILQGALWNTLIFAARGRRVLSLIRRRFPQTADALRGAMVAEDPTSPTPELGAIYPHLATIDLSRDVLECSDCPMAVTPATRVGWSELGTPDRIAAFCDEMHIGEPSLSPKLHPPWEPSELELDREPKTARTVPESAAMALQRSGVRAPGGA